MSGSDLRAFLQLGFSHIDHLFTRLLQQAGGAEARDKILVEALSETFLEQQLVLFNLFSGSQEK